MARSTAKRIAAAAARKVTSTVTRKAAPSRKVAVSTVTPASNGTAKKPAAKKAPAKKAPAKKAPAKKAATKPAAKKAPAKKAPAKKAATKTATKSAAKKATARKAATKTATKSAAKRAPAKKAPAKKAPARKAATKTATKSAGKRAPATEAPAKKAPAKKSAPKKSAQAHARQLAVKSDEKPWTTAELATVRGELDEDAARLRSELNVADEEPPDLMRDAGDGAGNDQADVGSTTFERDHEMSLANNAREMLAQTERALARIDDGSYGVCESCGQPIGMMRVMAFPRATLCLSCKQREERR